MLATHSCQALVCSDTAILRCRGRYLCDYLAEGEAPTEQRCIFKQRSRWAKGHWQIFFSLRCPLLQIFCMNPAVVWLYTYGTWSYLCNIFTTPTFLMVPLMSLMFGMHPVIFSRQFAIAAMVHLLSTYAAMNYFRWGDTAWCAAAAAAAAAAACSAQGSCFEYSAYRFFFVFVFW
jgi:cellulose synthase/poly-beta-1,6-N-acetylglucosamine synthase-like glycosyltransferase